MIEAVDAYLTKVNYPVEESRMQFVLVREVDSWYISVIFDEKFAQLQQQLQGQSQLNVAFTPPGAAAPTGTGEGQGHRLAPPRPVTLAGNWPMRSSTPRSRV